ncbi:hypothetical protein DSM106972_069290 [Dulcicalothrix desertica PCC 7102]|uniref:Uncharacterized protein n=1 Tax=Dulcicalothrix desertica PCC 7102 TaxID=232991 RepID=A0A3S1AI94_9CYAN|nr:hypothetical protein [Dulcicalothrix desertica]RUT01378.1 hypothetical protein DSM106972_069290 [Dulcicalothrix desertica PCC 7102]
MAYNEFTWGKARQDFGLTAIEGTRFFGEIEPVAPSEMFTDVTRTQFTLGNRNRK